MLQDRGILVAEGDHYVVKGDVSDLDVPESLHALVASRLDGLSPVERSLLQDASVLGQSFSAAAVASLSGRTDSEVTKLLDGLVAKQVLARDDDPRSPERGQYVFLQTLLQTVAYGTLSRHIRKGRHVAAARHLEQTWPGEAYDIAEVLASHYLEAVRADPEADDVDALRAAAGDRLSAAGRAAASLALGVEADRYFQHAAELTDDELERAELLEQAGASRANPAAVTLAQVLRWSGRVEEALALLEPFRSAEAREIRPTTRAHALAALAATLLHAGKGEEAGPLFDDALTTLEAEQDWPPLVDALVARGAYLLSVHRLQEGIAVLRHALALATEHDLPGVALRARFNLAGIWIASDRYEEAITETNEALVLARERGDRAWEYGLLSQVPAAYVVLGRWDDAIEAAAPVLAGPAGLNSLCAAAWVTEAAAARGDDALLERCRELAAERRDSAHIDERAGAGIVEARAALESRRMAEALSIARPILDQATTGSEFREESYAISVAAAQSMPDEAALVDLDEFVSRMRRSESTPLFRAGQARVRAELAQRRGDSAAARGYEHEAVAILRALGARPLLAEALLEQGRRTDDEGAVAEARRIYDELGAIRRLERIDERRGLVA
jgi:tetratricopeptide (TPR) repeat protein